MVDVGVGQDDVIHVFGFDHGVTVGGIGIKTFALEHTAVEQNVLSVVGSDQVFATCDFLNSSNELYLHGKAFVLLLFNDDFLGSDAVFGLDHQHVNASSKGRHVDGNLGTFSVYLTQDLADAIDDADLLHIV